MVSAISGAGSSSYASTTARSQESGLQAQITAKRTQMALSCGPQAKALQQQITALNGQLQTLQNAGSTSTASSGCSSTGVASSSSGVSKYA